MDPEPVQFVVIEPGALRKQTFRPIQRSGDANERQACKTLLIEHIARHASDPTSDSSFHHRENARTSCEYFISNGRTEDAVIKTGVVRRMFGI